MMLKIHRFLLIALFVYSFLGFVLASKVYLAKEPKQEPFLSFAQATFHTSNHLVTGTANGKFTKYALAPIFEGTHESERFSGVLPNTSNNDTAVTIKNIDGDLLIIADNDIYTFAHYFHLMEHLVGVWNFLTYKNSENVVMILLVNERKNITQNSWYGPNEVSKILLTTLFPNAEIYEIENVSLHDLKANNIYVSNRLLVQRSLAGAYNMNEPVLTRYSPDRLRKMRDKVFAERKIKVHSASDHLRITYVSRAQKRTMNKNLENQLLNAIEAELNLKVNVVDFATMTFDEQLQIVANTDVLMGVHGNGLTHLVFLPDNATVIEFYANHPAGFFKVFSEMRDLNYYGNYHKYWVTRANPDTRTILQDADVTQVDIAGTVNVLKQLNQFRLRIAT